MVAANDIVVIGGGFIGLEAAATFAALGKHVTVIELAPSILGRAVSPIVAAHVDAEYRKLGIRVLTATGIKRLEGEAGKVKAVRLSDGSAVPADLVLVGIGATPNDALARDAGLVCDNGIVVDATLATADPTIFAIGDVANFPHAHAGRRVRLESVQNASDQAKHVAKTIMGKPDDYSETPWFWSDQGHMKLQMAGLSFGADRHVRTGAPGEPAFSVYHYAGDRLLAVDSVNRPGDHMVARRLIAAGISPSDADLAEGPDRLKSLIGR
jgi:3-phenylpropionate/trans-cinnamate dioxygenase ferredoxin reductase component